MRNRVTKCMQNDADKETFRTIAIMKTHNIQPY